MKSELNRLLVALRASNALTDAEFTAVQDSLSQCEGETAVGRLLQDLVQAQKLTSYQAKQLAAGQTLVLGEYLIEDLLGEGGMGKVYKAIHLRLRRPVALKVIQEKYLRSDSQSAARFEREGRAIARLKHPNIVTAYDAGLQDGVCFLAMEYIEGVTLDQLIAIGGPISVREALDCLTQTAQALEYAHRHGVVHRDIKPSNLMVERSTHHIKVLDLGVARLAADNRYDRCTEDLTATGEIMGTFDYMPPEQADDAKLVDHRGDIYSLGCTLYLMITGKKIYEHATTRFEKTRAHREDPVPSLSQTDAPADVADLFEQMVKKDPDERLQSMAEVVDRARDIRRNLFRDGSPTVTMNDAKGIGVPDETDANAAIIDPVAGHETRPQPKRRRGKFVVTAALLALLVVAAVLLGPRIRDMIAGSDRDSPSPPITDPGTRENGESDPNIGTPRGDPVEVKLALLQFLVQKRRAIEDAGPVKLVAEIHVSRIGGPPEMVTVNTDFDDKDFDDLRDAKRVDVHKLDLSHTDVTDQELARLSAVTELEYLSLYWCKSLTDETFRPLQELTHLNAIDLRGTMLSGEGLGRLPDAPLENLDLDGFHHKLTGADVVEVAKRFKTLQRISAQGIPLDPLQEEQLRPLLDAEKREQPAPDIL